MDGLPRGSSGLMVVSEWLLWRNISIPADSLKTSSGAAVVENITDTVDHDRSSINGGNVSQSPYEDHETAKINGREQTLKSEA